MLIFVLGVDYGVYVLFVGFVPVYVFFFVLFQYHKLCKNKWRSLARVVDTASLFLCFALQIKRGLCVPANVFLMI